MHRSMINYILIYALFILQLQSLADSYVLPDPTFEVLQPRGLLISIPDAPGLQLFAFNGNVNKGIRQSQSGEISGQAYRARDGKWTIQNDMINLRDGDVIHYWIYAQADGSAYQKDDRRWTVVSNTGQTPPPSMERLGTTSPSSASDNNLLLNENFDALDTLRWSREIKMPLAPDYEFCVYHNENHEYLVQNEGGILRIKPLILEDYYGENATSYGRIQLGGCTSNIPVECTRQAVSYNIIPPVISARLTTKQTFSFRYGKIEIRAKFPEGDWLYPEMWLEPKYHSYGLGYTSGRILLGLARGNENLVKITDRTIYDGRKLDFGVRIANPDVKEYLVSKVRENGPRWTQDFHVYTTIWNADGLQFLVDGQEVGRLTTPPNGWFNDTLNSWSRSAPFDQEFYITLGVGVGGVRVFPDGTSSSGYPKPWKNVGAKATLKFWHARNEWLPSWRGQTKTQFEIDYVRVWSS